jgi:multisubunit Na+/H+ antiporter MnhB subunit
MAHNKQPPVCFVVFLFAVLALASIPLFDTLSSRFINSSLPEALGIRTWVSAYFITVGYISIAVGILLALIIALLVTRMMHK